MTSTNQDHAQFARVTSIKAAAVAEVTVGMTREAVEEIIARHAAELGKQARKSLRTDCYAAAGLGSPASYHEDKGHLVTSSRGTYATQIGSKNYALTREECEARGLPVGPGNK